MARKFEKLKAGMPAKRRARAEARASRMLAEMLLGEIRKAEGLTQAELAAILASGSRACRSWRASATCRSAPFAGSSKRSVASSR